MPPTATPPRPWREALLCALSRGREELGPVRVSPDVALGPFPEPRAPPTLPMAHSDPVRAGCRRGCSKRGAGGSARCLPRKPVGRAAPRPGSDLRDQNAGKGPAVASAPPAGAAGPLSALGPPLCSTELVNENMTLASWQVGMGFSALPSREPGAGHQALPSTGPVERIEGPGGPRRRARRALGWRQGL